MRKILLLVWLAATFPAMADEDWQLYSSVDLFAYSAPVSVERFAKNFDEPLDSGDTAFTHDVFELGVRYKSFRVAYTHRFDYITSFTEDTALVHHSEKNGIALPTNREYSLLLDVERLSAKGIKVGYTWQALPTLSIDVAGAWYSDLRDLQSGQAGATGDLEPVTDALIQQARTILDGITSSNRDLSPLVPLVADVNATVLIDYAYDQPKFDEPFYQKPVIIGAPNPVLSGVDFTIPGGSGYSVDIAVAWQATPQLMLRLKAIDIANKFSWDNAPQTRASFDLNPTLIDAISVAQEFVNGGIVTPNELIDRHLFVDIFNADFEQKLPWRADLDATYSLDRQASLFGWNPNLSVVGGYYRTETRDFPRIGVGLGTSLKIEYDFGGKAVIVGYQGRYGFARVVADSFSFGDAHTLGFAVGINYGF